MRRLHNGGWRGPQIRRSGRLRTRRPRNIQPNELGIHTQAALNQLPLHLYVFGTEVGPIA